MRTAITFAKIDTECTFFLLFTRLSTRSATDSPTDQDLWPFTLNSSMALGCKQNKINNNKTPSEDAQNMHLVLPLFKVLITYLYDTQDLYSNC